MENIKDGINEILSGKFALLADDTVRQAIPGTVIRLLENGKDPLADELINAITRSLTEGQQDKIISMSCLTQIADALARAGQWQRLHTLVPFLLEHLQSAELSPEHCSMITGTIERLLQHALHEKEYRQAADILVPVSALTETTSPLDNATRENIFTLLSRLAALPVMTDIQDNTTNLPEHGTEVIRLLAKFNSGHNANSASQGVNTPDDSLADQEEEIFTLAENGQQEEALQKLFDLIVLCARNKDFPNAERLRERIDEINPMALTEIIRSGEIIEQEKTEAVDEEQLAIWRELTAALTPEEFAALYHQLEQRLYGPEEVLVEQGAQTRDLLFINKGSAKISYRQGEKEIFVKNCKPGDLVGESFFDATVWTVSLNTLTNVEVSALTEKGFNRLHADYPLIKDKLESFYRKHSDINTLLNKKGLNRRKYDRFSLARKIQIEITDQHGQSLGKGFRSECTDISAGGIAFLVRISNKANARLLLGRYMTVIIPVGGDPDTLEIHGQAIGVQLYQVLDSDYSIHLKFTRPLSEEELQTILG